MGSVPALGKSGKGGKHRKHPTISYRFAQLTDVHIEPFYNPEWLVIGGLVPAVPNSRFPMVRSRFICNPDVSSYTCFIKADGHVNCFLCKCPSPAGDLRNGHMKGDVCRVSEAFNKSECTFGQSVAMGAVLTRMPSLKEPVGACH